MKLRSMFFQPIILRSLLLGLTLGTIASGATAATNAAVAAGSTPVKDVKLASPALVSESVFVTPSKPNEGKDPFFPRSTRPYVTVAPPKVGQTPAPIQIELSLRGISGTLERPLAIINNYTFSAGEEREVSAGNSRLKIRCIEINVAAGAVLVQIGSERRELRLSKP